LKALITGIGGFVGQAIANCLIASDHDVIGFGRNLKHRPLSPAIRDKAQLVEGNVYNGDLILELAAGCDAIFHCAALVGPENYFAHPVETMEIETVGLRNSVLAALQSKANLIYLSSSAVYGNVAEGTLSKEDDIVAPTSSYAVAKRYNELYLQAQHSENGLSATVLRLFNVYGPGQVETMVIPRFLSLALNAQPLSLFGGGRQTRDFVYIDDVAQVAVLSAQIEGGYDIFNVGTGVPISIAQLAEMIRALTNSKSAIETPPTPPHRAPVEVSWSVGSTERLDQQLGFAPKTTLLDGLAYCLATRKA